jgi:hypothetical protein
VKRGVGARVGVVYVAVAAFTFACWYSWSRTERPDHDGLTTITRLADGTAYAPFVQRRLTFDVGRLVAVAVPRAAWTALTHVLDDGPAPARALRRHLDHNHWKPADYPILFSVHLEIFLSIVGFMFVVRWLVRTLYDGPERLADALGAVFGVLLLGGYADWRYPAYPYDFPNAFVFALALTALLARKPWFPLAFVAAVYSKETAVLLVVAYGLLRFERRSWRYWSRLAALALTFVAIRGWIARTYDSPPAADYALLGRNLRMLAGAAIYQSWLLVPLLITFGRVVVHRRRIPDDLVRLFPALLVLLVAALMRGWFEELRGYFEALPFVGLVFIQVLLEDWGFGSLLRKRPSGACASRDD